MIEEREARVENPTEMFHGAGQLDGAHAHPVGTPDAPEPPYMKEALFSKRVMFGWAFGTLVAWFAITVIAPPIVESVVEAVTSSVSSGPAGTTTIETKRGTITIIRDAEGRITVHQQEPESATPVPSSGPGPAPAAVPLEPAEPLAPVEPTGKK